MAQRALWVLCYIYLCLLLWSSCAAIEGFTPAEAPTPPLNATAHSGTTSQPATGESHQSPISITFGSFAVERSFYEPLIRAFNAVEPNIHVQFVELDQAIAHSQENGRQTGDSGLAVAQSADTLSPSIGAIHSAYLLDLAPFIVADPTMARDAFFPQIRNLFDPMVDGKVTMLPVVFTPRVLGYNKALFAVQGLPLPTSAWTWRDIRDAATRLAQQDANGDQIYGLVYPSQEFFSCLGN